MPPKFRHWTTLIFELKPHDQSDSQFNNSFAQIWRRPQRGSHRVSDKSRALSENSLPLGHVRSDSVERQSLSRDTHRRQYHKRVLWALESNGQVWSQKGQVHGMLLAVPWRCGAQRCQCGDRAHKDKEDHSVCGLVSDRIQGRAELPAAFVCSRRGLGEGSACLVYAVEYNSYCRGVAEAQSQIWFDVC